MKQHLNGLALTLALSVLFAAVPAAGQVLITEVMHSPGGDDSLWEWIEIANTTGSPLNLDGWVFDDDDNPNLSAPNITSAGGTRNTIVPAGGVAVLYAGDQFNFATDRFTAAWSGGVTLVAVDGLTALTDADSIGLWPNHAAYLADTIPMSTVSPRRTFTNAAASLNYTTGFPEANNAHSIAWNGSGSPTDGANWVESQAGLSDAYESSPTFINDAPINSINDRGNPGVLPPGPAAAGLLITEIMFAPESPLATVEYAESDFEWVEIYNNTNTAINFTATPYVFDDIAGDNLAAANLNAGSLDAGGIGILFNAKRITTKQMQSIWGDDLNYIPVTNWPALNNDGDTIAIWDSYAEYSSEPVAGTGRTQQNAAIAVTFDTVAGDGWPTANDQSSIWLDDLDGDPNLGASWTRAGASGDTISRQPSVIFGQIVDHEGGDVGSPGIAPGFDIGEAPGDYNDDGIVNAADYALWRKLAGTLATLPNDPYTGTTIDTDQYNTWRSNFGTQLAAGHAVPEPNWTVLVTTALFAATLRSRPPHPPLAA